MFGKTSHEHLLESRKQLLIAECERSRAQLSEEWQGMKHGVRELAAEAKTIAGWASSAALLVAGLRALRRGRAAPRSGKASWLQKGLTGARLAWAIWGAFRTRRGKPDTSKQFKPPSPGFSVRPVDPG